MRSQAAQYQVYKIPLNNTDTYGGAGNGFSPIFSPGGGSRIPSVTRLGLAALPKAGAIGVAANGVPIYPSFDNADYVVWEVCEGDACSSHAGVGRIGRGVSVPLGGGGEEGADSALALRCFAYASLIWFDAKLPS